jgi:hypothetical protein
VDFAERHGYIKVLFIPLHVHVCIKITEFCFFFFDVFKSLLSVEAFRYPVSCRLQREEPIVGRYCLSWYIDYPVVTEC